MALPFQVHLLHVQWFWRKDKEKAFKTCTKKEKTDPHRQRLTQEGDVLASKKKKKKE